jgi:2-dehydro-3-deoxyphosphogluconate aldolase/(4S)-4-hydroxy-2-oxoglutarate aldolase
MTKAQVLHKLHEVGLVPVLRAESVEEAVGLASVIAAGGVTVLEIMMTVSGAIDVIRQLKKDLPHVMIGAGTVRYQELDLYLRQSHAERDLHTLGELERFPV